jgi:hypothetical protein
MTGDMRAITIRTGSSDPPITVRHRADSVGYVIEQGGDFYWSMSEDQLRQLVAAAQAVLEDKGDA